MSSGSYFVVDDHDIQSISYSADGLWSSTIVSSDEAYGGTVTYGIAGAKASLNFTGSAVAVSGLASTVANTGPPAVQFSLDGKIVQTTVAPNNGTVDTPFKFPFLVLDSIQSGPHTLRINVLNASRTYPFALDYIIYQPVNGATPTASQSAISTSLPFATGQSASNASSSSRLPVGAIVGGVVGGVAVLVAAAVAIWFLCVRGRHRDGTPYFYASTGKPGDLLDEQEAKPIQYAVGSQSIAHPSAANPNPGSPYGAVPPPQSVHNAPSDYFASNGYQPQQYGYAPSEAPASEYGAGSSSVSGPSHPSSLYVTNPRPRVSPNQPGQSKAAEAGLLSVPQQATYHADSGVRFDEHGQPQSVAAAGGSSSANVLEANAIVEVPPEYSAS